MCCKTKVWERQFQQIYRILAKTSKIIPCRAPCGVTGTQTKCLDKPPS